MQVVPSMFSMGEKVEEKVIRPIIMNEKVFARMTECAKVLHPGFRSVLLSFDSAKSAIMMPVTRPLGYDRVFPQNSIIFSIRLLAIDFHQVVGHMFYFQNVNMLKVADAIKAYIYDLFSCGFRVVATTTSGSKEVLQILWELQLDYNEKGFYEFDVAEHKKIALLFDPSWLLRELNRVILSSDVYFLVNDQTMLATNEFINEYNANQTSPVDLNDGRTTSAAKLFSQTIARSLNETDISFFCKLFDALFDSMNSIDAIHEKSKILRQPYNQQSEHNVFWGKCVPILKTMMRSTDIEIKCKLHSELAAKHKLKRNIPRGQDSKVLSMRYFRLLDYQSYVRYARNPQTYQAGLDAHLRKITLYWDTLNNVCNGIALQIHMQISKLHQTRTYKKYPPDKDEKHYKNTHIDDICLVFDRKLRMIEEQQAKKEDENIFLMYDGDGRIDEVSDEKKNLVNDDAKLNYTIEVNNAVESNDNVEINVNDLAGFEGIEVSSAEVAKVDESCSDDEFGEEKCMFIMYGEPKLKLKEGTAWFYQNVPFTMLKGIDGYDDLPGLLKVVLNDTFMGNVKTSKPKSEPPKPKKEESDEPKYLFKNHYINIECKPEPMEVVEIEEDNDQRTFLDLVKTVNYGDKTLQEVYMGVLATLKENLSRHIQDYNEEQLSCLTQEVLYLQGSIQKILRLKHLVSTTMCMKTYRPIAAIFKAKAYEKFLNLSVFDMWINTIRAMQEVYVSLTCYHVPTLCTKRVNCDLLQDFIYKLRVANGVPCAINIVEPQVGDHLDIDLSKFALTEDCSYTVR